MLATRGQPLMTPEATIRVPASTANLGPAFDAAGLALRLYLRVRVAAVHGEESTLESHGEDRALIPEDGTNLIWRTMVEVAAREGKRLPAFRMRIDNEIPVTKGLGSSAAAVLAGAAAADVLCGLGWDHCRFLGFAAEKEGHPDNAAPALMGGLVSSISAGQVHCARIEFPDKWTVVTVTPDFELETKRARGVLPEEVSFRDAVFNVQRAAFLMAQLSQGRSEGVREAMRDRLHQPYRSALLPGLEEILGMKDPGGLIGIALSGAGSTVVAFAEAGGEAIGRQIQGIYERHGLRSEMRLLKADNTGMVVHRECASPRGTGDRKKESDFDRLDR